MARAIILSAAGHSYRPGGRISIAAVGIVAVPVLMVKS